MLILPCPVPSILVLITLLPVLENESFILDYDEKFDVTEPSHRYNA